VTQPGQQAVGAGEQFYVTHCTTTDSVLNNPGYTVRAASSSDADTLDAAFHYPPYELPIDLWKDLPRAEVAPCRLARTEHEDGGVWAVHSAYLEQDTVGRPRSYFSHLMLLPAADPANVLRSWGADGWAKGYPQGAPKQIPDGARLPVGALVSDAALTAFLGDDPPGPFDLSSCVCPARLRGSASERRDLFARVLQALLLLVDEENESRHRLYIHAEPGLIALTLYGAVRLLPPTVTDNLTFSTFEPYHRNFRDYKLAEVVGTYLGSSEKGLDTDLGTTRGVALDTFFPARSSPELRKPLAGSLPAGVSDLIELAARGEWTLLPSVRHSVGADVSGLARAGKALVRARGLARVDAGDAGVEELLALQEDRLAAEELKLRSDKVWPRVKEAALSRADVRAAFRDLISEDEHVRELWEEAVDAVLKEDFRRWDSHWGVLREVPGRDEARKLLNKFVGNEKNGGKLSKVPTDVRARLRAACRDVGLLPPRALLVPIGLGELEPLLTGPPDWAGYTAFVLMAKDSMNWLPHVPAPNRAQMRNRAREFLLNAPPPALAAYVHSARPYLDADSDFLDVLFKPYSASAAKLMDRLLAAGTLEPGDWMKLCTSVGLVNAEWGDFLLEKDHLASLLVGLGADGVGKDLWAGYLALLTPALISPELVEPDPDTDPQAVHDWERKVHTHLRTAAERLTTNGLKLAPALPEGGISKLFAANNLLKWVDNPASAERDGPDELQHACATYDVDRLDLVRIAYTKGGYDQLELPAQLPHLEPIVSLFRTAYPVDGQYHTARSAVTHWLRFSTVCPARTRGYFQAHFVLACVPDLHYAGLLGEQRQYPFEPLAEATIRQRIAAASKKSGPKYVPPAPAEAEAAPVEDEPFADETAAQEEGDGELPESEEVTTPKGRRRSRGSTRADYRHPRSRSGSNTWLWLIVLLAVLTVLIVVVVIVMKTRH
jgi:hypothetical protein